MCAAINETKKMTMVGQECLDGGLVKAERIKGRTQYRRQRSMAIY